MESEDRRSPCGLRLTTSALASRWRTRDPASPRPIVHESGSASGGARSARRAGIVGTGSCSAIVSDLVRLHGGRASARPFRQRNADRSVYHRRPTAQRSIRVNRIPVVEDNVDLAYGLHNNLEIEGYAGAGRERRTRGIGAGARKKSFDLIILDLMMPASTVFVLLKALREHGDRTPILILAARGQEEDKVRGLKLGADDYVTKPRLECLSVSARIEALLRRTQPARPAGPPGALRQCRRRPRVAHGASRKHGVEVPLSPKEFDLVWALIEAEWRGGQSRPSHGMRVGLRRGRVESHGGYAHCRAATETGAECRGTGTHPDGAQDRLSARSVGLKRTFHRRGPQKYTRGLSNGPSIEEIEERSSHLMPLRRPNREELAAAIIAPAIFGIAAFAWLHREATAASDDGPRIDLSAPMPPDSQLVSGKLANDLQYFVRPNRWPVHRAELRVVVQCRLDSRDERSAWSRARRRTHGLSRNEALSRTCDRRSSDDGRHARRAATSMRRLARTRRSTPSRCPPIVRGLVDTSLAILADMVSEATFDSVEARQEAGVVMEEWRSRTSAGRRMTEARNALLLAGSPYADRPTIERYLQRSRQLRSRGDAAVLCNLVPARAHGRRCCRRRQCRRSHGAHLRKHFGSIRARGERPPRPAKIIPRVTKARSVVLHDPEATSSRLTYWFPDRDAPALSLEDYRKTLIRALWRSALDERLEDASEQPGSPLLSTGTGRLGLTRAVSADYVSVQPAVGREQEALDTLVAQVARLTAFPLSSTELRRFRNGILRDPTAAPPMSGAITPAIWPTSSRSCSSTVACRLPVRIATT